MSKTSQTPTTPPHDTHKDTNQSTNTQGRNHHRRQPPPHLFPRRERRRNPRPKRPKLRRLTQPRTGRTTKKIPPTGAPRTDDHCRTDGRRAGCRRSRRLTAKKHASPRHGSIAHRGGGSHSSHHPHPYTTEKSPQVLRLECAGRVAHTQIRGGEVQVAPRMRGAELRNVRERATVTKLCPAHPGRNTWAIPGATPGAQSEVGNIPTMHTKPPYRPSNQ